MWILISIVNPDEQFHILSDKQYVVGRKDCDILIPGDQSISRKHAMLQLAHPESNISHPHKPPVLKLQDLSKFGTLIGTEKLKGKVEHVIRKDDVIQFGTGNCRYKAVFEPLVVTASCLEQAAKKNIKNLLCKLGGHVVSDWRKDCHLLVMSTLSVTVKAICALVSQKPIVTPKYLEELIASFESSTNQPHYEDFIPPLAESQLNPDEVSFRMNPERQSLFVGKIFIFLSPKQFKKLSVVVELAGGTPMLMEEGTDDNEDDILVAPTTCVMHGDPKDSTQALSQNAQDWLHHVMIILKKYKRRPIMEPELGYAVLYCSIEKFCNPSHEPAVPSNQKLPSQSLSEMVVGTMEHHTEQTPRQRNLMNRTEKADSDVVAASTVRHASVRVKNEPISQTESKDIPSLANTNTFQQNTTSARKRAREESEDECASKCAKHDPLATHTVPHFSRIKTEAVTPKKPDPAVLAGATSSRNLRETDTKPDSLSLTTIPESDRESARELKAEITSSNSRLGRHDVKESGSPDPSPIFKGKAKNADGIVGNSVGNSVARQQSPDVAVTSIPESEEFESKDLFSRAVISETNRSRRGESTISTDDKDYLYRKREKNIGQSAKTEQISVLEEENGDGQNEASVFLSGYLNTKKPQQGDIERTSDCVNEEEALGHNLIVTEHRSLLVRKPGTTRARRLNGDTCNWKGKTVKNFKKFRKTRHGGSVGLPNIIGGSDLVLHENSPRKERDDWFDEVLQDEMRQQQSQQEGQDLFDFKTEPKKRKRY